MNEKRNPLGCEHPKRPPECPLGGDAQGPEIPAIFDERSWTEVAKDLALSPRQLQLVRAAFDDQTEFAIADDLEIAQSTVHTHFERLYQKLGVHDRVQLITRFMKAYFDLIRGGSSELAPICPFVQNEDCPLFSKLAADEPDKTPAT